MISLNIIRWLWFTTLMTLMTFMTFLTLFIFFSKGKEKTAVVVLSLRMATGFSIELHSLPELLELLESWAVEGWTQNLLLSASQKCTEMSCDSTHGLWKFQTIAVLQCKNHGSSIFLFLSRRCCAYFASKPSRCLLRVNTHFHSAVSPAYATNAEMKSASTNPLYKGSHWTDFDLFNIFAYLFLVGQSASLPIDPTPNKNRCFKTKKNMGVFNLQAQHPAAKTIGSNITWRNETTKPHLPKGLPTRKNDCMTSFFPHLLAPSICWKLCCWAKFTANSHWFSRTHLKGASWRWKRATRAWTKRSPKSPKRSYEPQMEWRTPKLTTTEFECIKTLVFVVR